MKRSLLLLITLSLLTLPVNSQSVPNDEEDNSVKKMILLTELHDLELKAAMLDRPLARAMALADIASALWLLDENEAKKLLSSAYDLTLPSEDEQSKVHVRPVGAAPTLPVGIERARGAVRNRVLAVASREKAFADQLIKRGEQKLGSYEAQLRYTNLAKHALDNNDIDVTSQYILQAADADPTQLEALQIIRELAVRDRAAADKLIVNYIGRLRNFPLSISNQSVFRTFYLLGDLMFPSTNPQANVLRPGPEAMRAFIGYMIDSLYALEQREPGSLLRARGILLTLWLPVQQYAPELIGPFLALERKLRRPGDDSSLPQKGLEETDKDNYDKRTKDALSSDQPDSAVIRLVISQGDFYTARKLIGKLSDGPMKTHLSEEVNAQEAVTLADKGDAVGATFLAEKLNESLSILRVYPAILSKCASRKDQTCARIVVYQAMKQLRHTTQWSGDERVRFALPLASEFDPLLLGLSRLAKAVAPINEALALEVLDDTVKAANSSTIDTSQGITGLDYDAFRHLTSNNEIRLHQTASNFDDSLRRILALATICQSKAEELTRKPIISPRPASD